MRQLIRNREAYKKSERIEKKWDLSNVAGDFAVTDDTLEKNISSEGPMAKNLEFLIMMFLLRNNHISKIIKKSIDGLSDILELLKEKYDINDETRKSGTALRLKDITLPRLTGVLPSIIIAVLMYHEKVIKEIVPYLSIPGVIHSTTIKIDTKSAEQETQKVLEVLHAICCPCLPSLHPKEKKKTYHIHPIMLYVAIRMDNIIHKKEKDFTSLSDIMTYYKAGYESSATPEAVRVSVLKRVKLIDGETGEFTDDVISINKACYLALKTMRADDEYHLSFLKAARTGVLP